MQEQNHWFGRRPPMHGIAVAWGARAIFTSSRIDLLPDRQSWSDSNAETLSGLRQWINEKGLPRLRVVAKRLGADDSHSVVYDDGDFHIEASPQKSGGYLYIGAWQRAGNPPPPRTLAAWKARLIVGTKLRCSYRWHTPEAHEVVVIQRVQTNAVGYEYLEGKRPGSLRPGQLAWMYFPRKDRIRFIEDGFELMDKNDGGLMSRYHWL